jgi:hypothetical protein
MKFAQLTAPDGEPVFVNPDAVQAVRASNSKNADPAANAILELASGAKQAVREIPTVVVSRLEGPPALTA